MKLFTFNRGGIHPPENKNLSEHQKIQNLPLPDQIFINLNQHLGKPAKAIVKLKQEISVGDLVAEADGFTSVNIHSPVSGTVFKIRKMMTVTGSMAETVIIQVNKEKTEEDEQAFAAPVLDDIAQLDSSQLKEKIKNAGVVGEGGATFSTFVKLSPPPDKKIDTIILNGAECEPYLTADHQLMLEKTEEILKGTQILQKILNVNKVYIGIETNKPDAIAAFEKRLASGNYAGVEVAPLKTKYPQGGEKQLIQAILKREVPSGKLPFDVGALVQNVGTVFAIFEAVYFDKPLFERITTVSGFVNSPGNFKIRIGTPIDFIIENGAKGFKDPEKIREVLNGGPMMGKAIRQLDLAATKGTSGLLALSETEFKYVEEGPCIRCGRCIAQCPMGLMPTSLALHATHEEPEYLSNSMDCIECGTCSYVCPTNRQLVHRIRVGKSIFRNANRS